MLSERLKNLRERRDYTQKYISKILNITPSAYSFYETGKNTPPLGAIVKLAELYNVSTDYLLERKPLEIVTTGEFDFVSDIVEVLQNLSVTYQRQFYECLQNKNSLKLDFFINFYDGVQHLSKIQQEQIFEYLRLLKLDNSINGQTAKKKAKKTKSSSFAPALAAYGEGRKNIDHEMDEDMHKAFDTELDNKEIKD